MSNDVIEHENDKKLRTSRSKKPKGKDTPNNGNTVVHPVERTTAGEDPQDEKLKRKEEKRQKKKEKKEKKSKEKSSVVQEDAMNADPDSTLNPDDRRSKKRKHSEEDSETPVNAVEKRKKKKDADRSVYVDGDQRLTVPVDGDSDSKKAKKDKKDKKKPPTPDLTSSTTSITPIPLPATHEIQAFLTKNNITITLPEKTPPITPILTFDQLSIPDTLRVAFSTFKEPSPIQACTWPPALEGKDVVGIAETGSGKTLAFGIPALSRLISHPQSSVGISVLVVAPTRELAIQTHETLSQLGEPFGIASVAVFGGVPKEPQIQMLKKVTSNNKGKKNGMVTRIVVGTPGRILDLVQEGACDLSGVDYLVLDEADRMLDKGFENDIRTIISQTRPIGERQTMMFSATWPEAVRRLASTFQRNPVRVTVGSDDLTANSRVEQVVEVFDDARSKDQRLLTVLRSLSHKKSSNKSSKHETTTTPESRVLVFALYKKEASRVEQMLHRQGYSVCALHGDMSQSARMEMLESFKNGATNLMVATDVAARGLDIPNVSTVINYTFPLTVEDYVHRIGRTGRGGKSGKSITFFTGDNHERALAGEFAKVLREGGFDYEALKKFPMTIKKKEHSVYGAFYRDDIPAPKGPTKIVF